MEAAQGMEEEQRMLLERCMASMAKGDVAFAFTFHEAFGPRVEGVVRGILREMGRHEVLADADEVSGLVHDAVMVILDRAGGWRPGGALPWNWAQRAIRAEVAVKVGHRTVAFGDGVEGEVSDHISGYVSAGGNMVVDLTGDDLVVLAQRNPSVELVLRAVRAAGSERDQKVFLEYRLQQQLGDPSPAHTVAHTSGLTAANVRQIVRRHGQKIRARILGDPTFEPVRHAAIFAG